MKSLIYFFLRRMFGRRRFHKLFMILRNIGWQGLNYRNTHIESNGELMLIRSAAAFFKNEQAVIFDVGANEGNYSRALLQHFQRACIYAFEPFPEVFQKLEILRGENSGFFAFNFGLSSADETLKLYTDPQQSEIGGLYNRDVMFSGIGHKAEISCTFRTIDGFCGENNITRIFLLKVDVEGHEFAVLKGGQRMLEEGRIDIIQFEFGAGNQFSHTSLLDFYGILGDRYRFYRLMRDGLFPLGNYNPENEVMLQCNIVAVSSKMDESFVRMIT